MVKIEFYLTKEFPDSYGITEQEVDRLLEEYEKGEELFFEDEKGRIELLQDGTLIASGYESMPSFFNAFKPMYNYIIFDSDQQFTPKIKGLVKKLVVSDGTKKMYGSFKGYCNLESAVIPDSVEELGYTFSGCEKLQPYKLPSSLKKITGRIFGIYPDHVVLPDSVEDVGEAFTRSSIKSIVFSKSIKGLCYHAFFACQELESVTFNEGLEWIASEAFSLCNKLDNVVLPKSLKEIGDYSFSVKSLKNLKILGNPKFEKTTFSEAPCSSILQAKKFDNDEPLEYNKSSSEISGFDEIKSTIQGKPLSEQATYFSVILSTERTASSYGEIDSSTMHMGRAKCVVDSIKVDRLVVKDGIMVGIIYDECTILVGETVCTAYGEDSDGTGSSSSSDYCTLVFNKNKEKADD